MRNDKLFFFTYSWFSSKITALPTVSAFNKGEVVDQFIGMQGKPGVERFVKKHAELA